MRTLFRSLAKQRERDRLAAEIWRAHKIDRQLARALVRLHRAWERRQQAQEDEQVALMDRCWWRRQERAEVMRAVSRENSEARQMAGG
jgi:hypothetical protein